MDYDKPPMVPKTTGRSQVQGLGPRVNPASGGNMTGGGGRLEALWSLQRVPTQQSVARWPGVRPAQVTAHEAVLHGRVLLMESVAKRICRWLPNGPQAKRALVGVPPVTCGRKV